MRYRITHRTSYRYGESVPLCQNALWLAPRNDCGQKCDAFEVHIDPEPSSKGSREDYFGNRVTYFAIESGFRSLDILAESTVTVYPRPEAFSLPESPAWDQIAGSLCCESSRIAIDACQFRYDSPAAAASPAIADYARESFSADRPIADATLDLTHRIHRDFRYEAGVTTVQTAVDTVFELRRGVCQDFAHLQIACLRSLGLAARYVSGYLRTAPPPGQSRLIGADASHAWLSVYCGKIGWIDFDPTNNVIPHADHVTVAIGRDYQDVTPVRGLFVGGGHHEMIVSVDVAPIDEQGSELKH